MSEVLVTIAVDIEKSYAGVQSGISALVARLNSNPPKIKVDFDIGQSEIAKLKQQISSVYSSVSKAGITSGGSFMQNIASGAKAANSQISATKAHISAVNAALKEIKVTNSNITSTYKNLSKALGGSSAKGQNATDLEAMRLKYVELETAVDTLRASKDNATQEDINNIHRLQSEMQNLMDTTQKRITTEKQAATAAEQAAKTETKAVSDRTTALRKYFSTLDRLNADVKNYSAAQLSRNSASRSAYAELKKEADAMEAYASAVRDGSASLDEMNKKTMAASAALKSNETIIKSNGDARKSIIDRASGLASKFTSWLSVSQVVMAAYGGMRNMLTASIDINSAMTQLKIVTGATGSEMMQFLTNTTSLAKELGQSITDVAGSVETFSRLGYNLSDASELAKYANILANVADTDSETATTGLTSIIKGYNMDVSEAEHVSDVLVKVGQEYAISAEELMAAFQRGGAALYASGTDFEKSAALFAATNASLQSAETTGTLWKTVSARIRGATTELSEMGEETDGLADGLSKYRDEIIALSGVDIMKDENTYKNMYDIFVQLAQVWDNMKSDEARSRVAEILGGTRQLSGIMSTITNIKDAIGAYESAMDSAGASTKAQAEIMDSVEGRIGVFKASFQELSVDVVNSDFVKGVVDSGTAIIEIIDNIVKKVGALPALLAGAGATSGVIKSIKNVA